jgi:hypothetical protein
MLIKKWISDSQFKKWPDSKKKGYLAELEAEIQKNYLNGDPRTVLDLIGEYEKKAVVSRPAFSKRFKEDVIPMYKRNIKETMRSQDELTETAQIKTEQKKEKKRLQVWMRSKVLRFAVAALFVAGLGRQGYVIYKNYQTEKLQQEKVLKEKAAKAEAEKKQAEAKKQAELDLLKKEKELLALKLEKEKKARQAAARKRAKTLPRPARTEEPRPKKLRPKRTDAADNTAEIFNKVQ